MIHPWDWSVSSLWRRVRWGRYRMFANEYEPFDVRGKVVLDVGAYDGDSAKYFLQRGAKEVIAIEKDRDKAERIPLNPKIHVVAEPFSLWHLHLPHDCMKMDIEGYETMLLGHEETIPSLKPTIMEVHNWWLVEQFTKRGFRVIHTSDPMIGICTMVNYP